MPQRTTHSTRKATRRRPTIWFKLRDHKDITDAVRRKRILGGTHNNMLGLAHAVARELGVKVRLYRGHHKEGDVILHINHDSYQRAKGAAEIEIGFNIWHSPQRQQEPGEDIACVTQFNFPSWQAENLIPIGLLPSRITPSPMPGGAVKSIAFLIGKEDFLLDAQDGYDGLTSFISEYAGQHR